MEAAKEYRLVLTTIDNYERARQIALTLVSEQLAACCNIVPGITSIYAWDNGVNENTEFLMLIKTAHALLPSVEQRLRELHSYDTPEIISISTDEMNLRYFNWMQQSLNL